MEVQGLARKDGDGQEVQELATKADAGQGVQLPATKVWAGQEVQVLATNTGARQEVQGLTRKPSKVMVKGHHFVAKVKGHWHGYKTGFVLERMPLNQEVRAIKVSNNIPS